MEKHTIRYALRNEKEKTFEIDAVAEGAGSSGSTVKATITRFDGHSFRYEVVFRGEFARTKENFTEEMYLLTALDVMKAQLESHVHEHTRIVLEQASGLMTSEVGARID
ncbi:MAG: hypothetical protein HY319_24465 [Armatimonadetes bacterium]|nr:hypothetical protein [Armatimonadota bacterium]